MVEIILKINGMMCEGCENRVKNALSAFKEIKEVKPSFKDGTVKIVLKKDLDVEKIKNTIANLGFKVI